MRRRRFGFRKIFFIAVIAIVAFLSIRSIYESLTFDPESFFEVPFRERAQTKSDMVIP